MCRPYTSQYKMAVNDGNEIFGDLSLFENFTEDSAPKPEPEAKSGDQDETVSQLRQQMEELKQENLGLKKQIHLLIHPGNLTTSSSQSHCPVAQVLFFNHDAVCFDRQEIEDFFQRFLAQSLDQENREEETGDIRPLPQRSSRPFLQDLTDSELDEAFTVTGNVQYYGSFCIDSLGRPLVNGDPNLTSGWTVPSYKTDFHEALPIEETKKPSQRREKRSKPTCWNCGKEDHSLRDCPVPRDMEKINAARKDFQGKNAGNVSLNKRYHKDGEGGDTRFTTFKAGQISAQLREALNLDERQVPPYIYQMRLLGYPPGYLKQAEVQKSGLTVYDISNEDEAGELSQEEVDKQLSYDPSKLIDYPGFNVPLPDGVREPDGMPPMQPSHSKDALRVLMTPTREAEPGRKRGRRDFSEDPDRKRSRTAGADRDEVDMELEGNTPGSVRRTTGQDSFTFKPPLPPTPIPETPPPLPTSTPPVTPKEDTARRPGGETPGSPPRSGTSEMEEEEGEAAEGSSSSSTSRGATPRSMSPSMDDLRQMQSRLQEALMQAAEEGGALVPGADSPGDCFVVDGEEFLVEGSFSEEEEEGRPEEAEEAEEAEEPTPERGDATVGEADESAAAVAEAGSPCEGATPEVPAGRPEVAFRLAADTPNRSGVPHLSKFAEGISPHENDNLSESTGMLSRILRVFKRKKGKASS